MSTKTGAKYSPACGRSGGEGEVRVPTAEMEPRSPPLLKGRGWALDRVVQSLAKPCSGSWGPPAPAQPPGDPVWPALCFPGSGGSQLTLTALCPSPLRAQGAQHVLRALPCPLKSMERASDHSGSRGPAARGQQEPGGLSHTEGMLMLLPTEPGAAPMRAAPISLGRQGSPAKGEAHAGPVLSSAPGGAQWG